MAAGKHNFLCEQGATFNPLITWRDESNALVDVTGYTARMQVRPTVASTTVTTSLTTENGRITLGGAAGTIELLITDEDTALLTPATYKYDLEMVSSGGTVVRLIKGNFKVDPEVTR
jgi:hypothetical protein